MASRHAIPIEIGKTRWADVAEAATRTTSADSVAYATDDSGSDAKIGSASHFGSSVSSYSSFAIGRPTTIRLSLGPRTCGLATSGTRLAPMPHGPPRLPLAGGSHAPARTALHRRAAAAAARRRAESLG